MSVSEHDGGFPGMRIDECRGGGCTGSSNVLSVATSRWCTSCQLGLRCQRHTHLTSSSPPINPFPFPFHPNTPPPTTTHLANTNPAQAPRNPPQELQYCPPNRHPSYLYNCPLSPPLPTVASKSPRRHYPSDSSVLPSTYMHAHVRLELWISTCE